MVVEERVEADRLTCGLRTTHDADQGVTGYRVGWIAWDSPFRDSALRIEDHIVGVNGVRYGAEGEGPSIYIRDPEGNRVELKGPPTR